MNGTATDKQYTHIFFDLDHTIWDFDTNARETLEELYILHQLEKVGMPPAPLFIETYTRNNHRLWADYHLGRITKTQLRETRFKQTFIDLGVQPEVMPATFENDYVQLCPTKTNLFPHAHETLHYLQQKYTLHLITNGFKEATELKTAGTDIARYFKNIIISEIVGVNKPHRDIFEHAVTLACCGKHQCLMIGDSLEADVRGAMDYGMDAIYFNPHHAEKPHDVPVQINSLKELTALL